MHEIVGLEAEAELVLNVVHQSFLFLQGFTLIDQQLWHGFLNDKVSKHPPLADVEHPAGLNTLIGRVIRFHGRTIAKSIFIHRFRYLADGLKHVFLSVKHFLNIFVEHTDHFRVVQLH